MTKTVAYLLGPSEGGIRRHVRYLASNPPAGWTATVTGPPSLASYFAGAKFSSASSIQLAFAGRKADLIHAHGLTAGLAAVVPGGPPVIVSLHLLIGQGGRTAKSALLRFTARAIVRRATAVVAASQTVAQDAPKAVVIHPAFDPAPEPTRSRQEVRSEFGVGPDEVVALTVSRLHADKRLEVFIEAVQASGATGWIAGGGPQFEELKGRVAQTQVKLLGYRDDVADLYAAADMFILTSAAEGYGIAVAEAIAAGLPVIASDTGAIAEITAGAALLCDPAHPDQLITATRELASDGDLRRTLRERAALAPRPDPQALTAELGRLYDKVIAR